VQCATMLFFRPLRLFIQRPSLVFHFHASPARFSSRKVIKDFKLADIGEGITECEVLKWFVQVPPDQSSSLHKRSDRNFNIGCYRNVKVQGTVEAFDPLCEVQSDKASVEITSPFDGIVHQLLVQEGQVAKVGEGLCLIEVEEESSDGDPAPPVKEEPIFQPQQEPEVEPVTASHLHPMDPSYKTPPSYKTSGEGSDVLAAPSVRHLARKHGINLSRLVPGSGKEGRIEKKDVEAHLASDGSAASGSLPEYVESEKDVVVELGRTRFGMWKAMVKASLNFNHPSSSNLTSFLTQSLEIPHFGYALIRSLWSG
jgi:2-oxoisovalerate dehydrogenase E2 component (dihydrolipoyl transacylase)